MRSLTKEAEQKLIRAIENAAALVNSGLAPNEAIIKSASEANIPAGHINLMVHAYNTGRTTKQRESGENVLEKAADFALADADTVLKALYPETVKTSAEIKRQDVVSAEYALSPAGMLARRQSEMRKAAAAAVALPEKTYVAPPRDEHAAAMRAYSEKVAAKREEEELRRKASDAYTKAAASMDDLSVYFRTPGNMSFGDAVREVGLRLGEQGVSVLHKVAAVFPHFTKQADTGKNHFGSDPLYGLVENVLSSVSTYTEAQQHVPAKKACEFSKKEAAVFLTGSILHEPADEPLTLKEANVVTIRTPDGQMQQALYDRNAPRASDIQTRLPVALTPFGAPYDDPRAQQQPQRNRNAGGGGGGKSPDIKPALFTTPIKTVGEAMGAQGVSDVFGTGPVDSQKEVKKQLDKVYNPEHEATIKSIRAKGVLHDLILNDPVVSGYDPQDVAMAFNDVAELSPSLIDAPGMLRSVLRKRLEAGQLADFDVKQLLEMEKLRADRDKALADTRRTNLETI